MTDSVGSGEAVGIVVVGASLAGMNAAQVLRRSGYAGPIDVIGDEPDRPYDRPPLSKEFLTDSIELDRLTLAPARKADELDLSIVTGRRATAINVSRSVLEVADSAAERGSGSVEEVPFEGLVVATGARARTLPDSVLNRTEGSEREGIGGVFTLRSLDDAKRLKAALSATSKPVVVCGAGFIGGEVAASARSLGCEVVLLEAADAPLTRVLDAEAGMAVVDLHRSHGVDVRLSTSLSSVEHDGSKVTAVTLSDGSEVATDVVVVGIGAVPNTEWLSGSDLPVDNGLVVDKYCRAADRIVAAGDVARFPNDRFDGEMMRIEQWDNAVEMARFAANNLLAGLNGGDEGDLNAFAPVPWFWSDQFDRKIQLAGVRSEDAVMAQGSFAEQMFVRLYHVDEVLCGVLAWNRPRQAIIGRQLIDQETSLGDALERLGG